MQLVCLLMYRMCKSSHNFLICIFIFFLKLNVAITKTTWSIHLNTLSFLVENKNMFNNGEIKGKESIHVDLKMTCTFYFTNLIAKIKDHNWFRLHPIYHCKDKRKHIYYWKWCIFYLFTFLLIFVYLFVCFTQNRLTGGYRIRS